VPCDEKNVCPSSQTCEKVSVCAIAPNLLADMITDSFDKWLTAHNDDAETRALMTQVWLDTNQYDKALAYWAGLLKQKPNDPAIMGALAGIELKSGNWRKSIEWYLKVADATSDVSAKVNALQFIGNVGWAKLNSKSLSQPESIELADRAIGALQKAAALSPDNPKYVGLQASIFNFRAITQSASFAAAIDRATAQDLQHRSRVLADEAKKAQGLAPPPSGSGSGAAEAPPKTGG
jgi:tetratricopeptide (TPR) repeat protein